MTTKDLAKQLINTENICIGNQDETMFSPTQQAIHESYLEEKEQRARSLATDGLEQSYNLITSQLSPIDTTIEPWGQHLVLDLGGCNENILTKEGIANFVKELVQAIDMVAYGEPQIVHFAEHSYEAAGYSLVQLIETSAIMGHFSDNNRDAYLDVFSCKKFSNDTAIAVVKKHFAPTTIKYACLNRGINLASSLLQKVG